MLNSHYSGRMENAIKRTLKKARGKSGKFYSILNAYGLYDVDDPNNQLTKEQRAQVPPEDQQLMSTLSNVIADMIAYFVSDGDDGVITNDLQEIIDKMDIRASSTTAEVNAIGTGISAIAQGPLLPLQSINASRQLAESQTASVMGLNPYNADMIPPISIGLDGLPSSIANTFKSGFFQPNWDFLYQHETVKSNKIYFTGDDNPRIGANIRLNQGGTRNDLFLKNVFSVNTVDKNLSPIGDVKGGLTAEQYNILKKAATLSESEIEADTKYSDFTLTDSQMQASYFKYVQGTLWDVINNRQNWAHSHWGALTNNACPEYVKTAVCSYLWTNGLAIDPSKSSEAGFISYCVTMGIYYLTGYQYSVYMYGISGLDKILDANNNVISVTTSGAITASHGLPKNETIAHQYFIWIADILLRLTYSTNSYETDISMRKRRIDEANLIYKGLGKPTVKYGDSATNIDVYHKKSELLTRKFDSIMGATILRYPNEGVAGGSGDNGSLQTPENNNVTIKFDSNVKSSEMTTLTRNVIKSLCYKAGITECIITSLYRPPVVQRNTMFNNLQNNKVVTYAAPGRKVVKVYNDYKTKYGVSSSEPFTDSTEINTVKDAMLTAINNGPPQKISKHSADPSVIQAVDISPTRSLPTSHLKTLKAVFLQAKSDGILRTFLGPKKMGGPGNDPAYHIEIYQNDKAPTGYDSDGYINADPPTVSFSIQNINLKKSSTWMNPLMKDHNDYVNSLAGSENQA